MKMSIITREVEQGLIEQENRNQAHLIERKLVALAKSYKGLEFRNQVEELVAWGLSHPDNRQVVKLVVRNLGQQVPEIALTLGSILAKKI